MNNNPFPKYNNNRQTAEKGVTLVKKIIEDEMGWIFRKVPLDDDFGLDGYVDIITENGYVTGKYFGIQIKTGKSYFSKERPNGWEFIGEIKHLNYYLNLDFPILIILVDLDSQEAFWGDFEVNSIVQARNGWKMIIDKENRLNKEAKTTFKKMTGEAIDYLPQLQAQWEMNKKMIESHIIWLAVDKSEIEEENYSGFTTLLKRITASNELIKELKGKLSFAIFGYEDDKRELYQIEEVRTWIKEVIPLFKYWAYFLYMTEETKDMLGLRILQVCSIDLEEIEFDKERNGFKVIHDMEQNIELMNQLFLWLNEFSDKYGIQEPTIFEQSMKVAKIMVGMTDEKIEELKTTYNIA
ncbi:MAG: DUF4365 and DUF1817 domain-containing protein [Balneola sp.]